MRLATLVIRGLRFYWRSHLGVFLGTAVAAAVLTGALLVGDSVRHTLATTATIRLGEVSLVLETGSRFLGESVAGRLEERLGLPVAPLLRARAVASRRGGDGGVTASAGVTLLGVDERFRRLAPSGGGDSALPAGEGILVGERTARELGVSAGDVVTLRIGRYGIMSLDAPLSSRAGNLTRLGSFPVEAVLADEDFGRFSLRAEQVPPANVFIDLKRLQEMLELPGKVNVMLVAGGEEEKDRLSERDADDTLRKVFGLGDAGYSLSAFEEAGVALLRSERVFIDAAVGETALSLPGAAGSLTWLVDSLAGEGTGMPGSTPYSFVAAVSSSSESGVSPVPQGMGDGEIILNRWAADELKVGKGDVVRIEYRIPVPSGTFVGRSRSFAVYEIVDMDSAAAERELVPSFPGLTNADTCRDWDIGLPLEEEKVLDEANESYWRTWRQTPKAFVTLAAGREMWSTRWGDLTGVRFPGGPGRTAPALADLSVDPARLGYRFRDAAGASARAVDDSLDFGGLFLGMSFFIIAAALALTAMLHSFAVQRRAEEAGLLGAVGFSPRRVTLLFLLEGSVATLFGAAAGALLGTFYTRALLWGLGRYWRSAVAEAVIGYHREDTTLLAGAAAAFLVSTAAVALTSGRQSKRPPRELLALSPAAEEPANATARSGPASLAAVVAGTAGASLTLLLALRSQGIDPSAFFFAAGALLLLSFLALLHRAFSLAGGSGEGLSPLALALRNTARRRWRSLGVAGIFACGCFVVLAVSSMKYDPAGEGGGAPPGTGGFDLFGESVLPILSDRLPEDIDTVPVKVRDGDDASCFNLNRAQSPRLLGVEPDAFLDRGAFVPEGERGGGWELLRLDLPEGVIPGLAGDGDTALWNLALKTGTEEGAEILYRDGRGREFRVRLVGALPVRKSIFQGSILISREAFSSLFPSEDGYRMFLFRPSEGAAGTVAALEERYSSQGLDVRDSVERLAGYYAVENTYLEMFLILGGLGLVLAVFGVGVVVLRNIEERRTEHALLGAVGFSPALLGGILVAEHALLFSAGLLGGVMSGLVAVIPALRSRGEGLPVADLTLLLAVLLVAGLLLIGLTVRLGTARNPLPALRKGEY